MFINIPMYFCPYPLMDELVSNDLGKPNNPYV